MRGLGTLCANTQKEISRWTRSKQLVLRNNRDEACCSMSSLRTSAIQHVFPYYNNKIVSRHTSHFGVRVVESIHMNPADTDSLDRLANLRIFIRLLVQDLPLCRYSIRVVRRQSSFQTQCAYRMAFKDVDIESHFSQKSFTLDIDHLVDFLLPHNESPRRTLPPL